MTENIKLAWRNLWRNRARTLLTAFAVFFIVILASIMSSQQYGIYDNMIKNIIEYSGHIQIQDTNYIENKTINNTFLNIDSLTDKILTYNHVGNIFPRLESFSLSSYFERTRGVGVLGIDAEKEKTLSKFNKKLVKYRIQLNDDISPGIKEKLEDIYGKTYIEKEQVDELLKNYLKEDYNQEISDKILTSSEIPSEYLKKNDDGVIIGAGLSKYLEIGIGDTLVMMSQGYHGRSAAGLFPVRGIIKLPDLQAEKRLVVMNLKRAQEFYSADSLVTALLITIDRDENKGKLTKELNSSLPTHLQANTWDELFPEFVQLIESDKASGVFMKGIFYMIVGFIIFGTILMVIAERRRESGVLVAIGMQRIRLTGIIFIETLFLTFLGSLAGLIVSYPIISMLHNNPIPLQGQMAQVMEEFGFEPVLFFSDSPHIFYTQALTIFIVSIIIFLLPLSQIINLNIIKSIRE